MPTFDLEDNEKWVYCLFSFSALKIVGAQNYNPTLGPVFSAEKMFLYCESCEIFRLKPENELLNINLHEIQN